VRSVYTYRTPLVTMSSAVETTRPLAMQVVLVVISGLRQDISERMPILQDLGTQGVRMVSEAEPPTYAQPTWTTLLTGAGPEINDADLLADAPGDIKEIKVDNLFRAAHRVGLVTGLVGHQGWDRLIPREQVEVSFITELAGAQGDEEVVETSLRMLKDFHPNLLIIHLNQVNEAAMASGGLGEVTFAAARQVDLQLRTIAEALDLEQACLIVTADHGHLSGGGHGGGEEEVTHTPLVLVGRGIKRTGQTIARQQDIAPTVAALLGMPMPGIATGRPIEKALDMTLQTRAEKQVSYATQRVTLAKVYLSSISGAPLSETARGDVVVAASSLKVGNYHGANQLASFSLERADEEMAQARADRLTRERVSRAPLGALALLIPFYIILRRSSRRTWYLFFCATVVVLVHHGLYLWQGGVYSLGQVASFDALLEQTLQRALIAVASGGLLALGGILIGGERALLEIWSSLLGFGLQACYLLAIPLAIAFAMNGFVLTWFIPDVTILFVNIMTLLQVTITAPLLALWPLPFVLVGLVLRGFSWGIRRVRSFI